MASIRFCVDWSINGSDVCVVEIGRPRIIHTSKITLRSGTIHWEKLLNGSVMDEPQRMNHKLGLPTHPINPPTSSPLHTT